MAGSRQRPHFLRRRAAQAHSKVTFIELFFDLVFVFAVTQLSHALLEHLSLTGALHTTLLLMAVWWVWVYTSWVTNWLDPERSPVRLLLLVLMLAGLLLSTSIPKAFETQGLTFAVAYAFMQVGRTGFTLWAVGTDNPGLVRNFQRILIWLAFAAPFWIAGGIAEGPTRLALWIVALAVEYLSASVGFRVPGLGRSLTSDWNVEGGHMAERCALFIIIALGESILVTGATFGKLAWNVTNVAAFAVSFVGSVAMWWIYFDSGHERASHHISSSADPGRLARVAYTYMHLPIVAGIIVVAVADELVLAHPDGHTEAKAAAVILGGPALYLLGNTLFKRVIAGRLPLSHLVGMALLVVLVPAASSVSPLLLATATTIVLVIVAVWEMVSLRSGRTAAADR